MRRINAWLLAAALAVGVAGFTPLLRAQAQSQDPSAQQQQPAQQTQTFTGKVSKQGDKYVLRDGSANMTYELDDDSN